VTFITPDFGQAIAATPRGDDAKTRRSKDGSWTKKETKSYSGYPLSSTATWIQTDLGLIRELARPPQWYTTAR
jgi:IS5 family transposase